VRGKLTVGPVVSSTPGEFQFEVCLVDDLDLIVDEIKTNTTPLTSLLNAGIKAASCELGGFVEREVGDATAFEEYFGIVTNVFFGSDKYDVIDVGVNGLAFAFGEIEEEQCCGLGYLTSVALTHAQSICFVVLVAFSKTKIVTDVVLVFELIVISSEIKRGEVRAFEDHVADVILGGETELDKRVLSKSVVEVDGFSDRTVSFFEELDDSEEIDVAPDHTTRNLRYILIFFEDVNKLLWDRSLRALVSRSLRHLLVHFLVA